MALIISKIMTINELLYLKLSVRYNAASANVRRLIMLQVYSANDFLWLVHWRPNIRWSEIWKKNWVHQACYENTAGQQGCNTSKEALACMAQVWGFLAFFTCCSEKESLSIIRVIHWSFVHQNCHDGFLCFRAGAVGGSFEIFFGILHSQIIFHHKLMVASLMVAKTQSRTFVCMFLHAHTMANCSCAADAQSCREKHAYSIYWHMRMYGIYHKILYPYWAIQLKTVQCPWQVSLSPSDFVETLWFSSRNNAKQIFQQSSAWRWIWE